MRNNRLLKYTKVEVLQTLIKEKKSKSYKITSNTNSTISRINNNFCFTNFSEIMYNY